ncbi:MAG: hypothetical protein WC445_04845 [Patescibacteria group bacterium]
MFFEHGAKFEEKILQHMEEMLLKGNRELSPYNAGFRDGYKRGYDEAQKEEAFRKKREKEIEKKE